MNENLNAFMTNLGVLCETWTVVYKNFLNQGLEPKEALPHTQGFMTAFINGAVSSDGGKK